MCSCTVRRQNEYVQTPSRPRDCMTRVRFVFLIDSCVGSVRMSTGVYNNPFNCRNTTAAKIRLQVSILRVTIAIFHGTYRNTSERIIQLGHTNGFLPRPRTTSLPVPAHYCVVLGDLPVLVLFV